MAALDNDDLQARLRELKVRGSRMSTADASGDFQAFRTSRASGIGRRSSTGPIKSLEDIESEERAVDNESINKKREKEAIARAYAHKLLAEKEAALNAQKQKEAERIREQKRIAEEKMRTDEERDRKRREIEDAKQRAEDERQAKIAEQVRIEQEKAQAAIEKAEKDKEKSLSFVRSKVEENRKKFEMQQKELETIRSREELERMKQKAIAVENDRNRQRMLQSNNEIFSNEIAAITQKIERDLAYEKQQNDAFQAEYGLSLQNMSKNVLGFLPWAGKTNEVKTTPPIPGEEEDLEQKPVTNSFLSNPLVALVTSPITVPFSALNSFFPADAPVVVLEEAPQRVIDMDNFIYIMGTTGLSVIIFLARGKDQGDALFYVANMMFDKKFDLKFHAITEFGNKELTFPCEVLMDVEDGRGYHHADSQPFTFSYENVASRTLHFKLLNKPDLNIQFESVTMKNDALSFFKTFLQQKLKYKQQKLGLAGLRSLINTESQEEPTKILWVAYAYRKIRPLLGLRKGKNIPMLLVVDNRDVSTLTLFATPGEEHLPINELKNSISKYFDHHYSPALFEGMGYSSLFSCSLKKCTTVVFLKDDHALEIAFAVDEGKTATEIICFEAKELQVEAGDFISKTYKKAKSS